MKEIQKTLEVFSSNARKKVLKVFKNKRHNVIHDHVKGCVIDPSNCFQMEYNGGKTKNMIEKKRKTYQVWILLKNKSDRGKAIQSCDRIKERTVTLFRRNWRI
jgi:ribosomal protein S8